MAAWLSPPFRAALVPLLEPRAGVPEHRKTNLNDKKSIKQTNALHLQQDCVYCLGYNQYDLSSEI
jgi:hypothetical protein